MPNEPSPDQHEMLQALQQATLRHFQQLWDDNRLTAEQAVVWQRLQLATGDENAIRIQELWDQDPPQAVGGDIDIEPFLRRVAVAIGRDPDEYVVEIVAMLTERGEPLHYWPPEGFP